MSEYKDRRQYYINNREKLLTKQKIYKEKHKKRIADYQREYFKKKRENKKVYKTDNKFIVTF